MCLRANLDVDHYFRSDQVEFSKACTALITNAKAPELIQKVLGQRDTILRMESIEGEWNRRHLIPSGFHFLVLSM